MPEQGLKLTILPDRLGICRFAPDGMVPMWAFGSSFFSVTRTPEELSVVCAEAVIPEGIKCERGRRALKISGPLDFSLTGVLVSVASPLARAGISIFVLSTYDTDYILIQEGSLAAAVATLRAAGHFITD